MTAMKSFTPGRWLSAALLLAILLPARPADAVIPSAFGPIQALIAILPQLLMALAAALLALFKPRTYKFLFAYLRAHKGLTLFLIGLVALLVWGPGNLFRGEVSEEQVGMPWAAFRGGPERSGAVPGALGPIQRPKIDKWRVEGSVDSSPAVVGNRIYFGVNAPSFAGGTGAIQCIDAETGNTVWKYTGAGELDPPLRPVFSSPAVWADRPSPDSEARVARYVVSGEGYHEDRDCRILCLDLAGTGGPKLNWAVKTTSHVESSPCIHDGRVYIGAGDDGVWCVDLETGKVLWRLEGGPAYEVAEGPQVEALAGRAGEQVAVTGTARRVFDPDAEDPGTGTQVLDVKSFRAHEGRASVMPGAENPGERVVIGRVVRVDGARAEGLSPFRIEVVSFFPDAESSPVGTEFPGTAAGAILFGTGIGGNALNCVDARTGELIWKAPVPYPAFGAPTVADGQVFTGVGNGNFLRSDDRPAGALLCFSLRDGRKAWEVALGDTILGAVAVREGRAYACSRDGRVTVIETKEGRKIHEFSAGSPSVCSPAVTDDSIYFATDEGKLYCLERRDASLRWSMELGQDQPIISSPAVAGGRLYVGTRANAVVCLSAPDPTRGPVGPWTGPGGNPGRTGIADHEGPPSIPGELADALWKVEGTFNGPLIACGARLYTAQGPSVIVLDPRSGKRLSEFPTGRPTVALAADETTVHVLEADSHRSVYSLRSAATGTELGTLATNEFAAPILATAGTRAFLALNPGSLTCTDRREGKVLWTAEIDELSGTPAVAHGLVFAATKNGTLACIDDLTGREMWSVKIGEPLVTPPTVSKERVLVASEKRIHCRRLVDGGSVWRQDLDEPVGSYLVASKDYLAFATKGENVAVLDAVTGKPLMTIPVGNHGTAPALFEDTLVFAAENRLGTFDLSAGDILDGWQWRYRDEDNIGRVLAPPVIVNGIVIAATEKRGLVAIGVCDPVSMK